MGNKQVLSTMDSIVELNAACNGPSVKRILNSENQITTDLEHLHLQYFYKKNDEPLINYNLKRLNINYKEDEKYLNKKKGKQGCKKHFKTSISNKLKCPSLQNIRTCKDKVICQNNSNKTNCFTNEKEIINAQIKINKFANYKKEENKNIEKNTKKQIFSKQAYYKDEPVANSLDLNVCQESKSNREGPNLCEAVDKDILLQNNYLSTLKYLKPNLNVCLIAKTHKEPSKLIYSDLCFQSQYITKKDKFAIMKRFQLKPKN
ncbi:hypothetical protein COBT_001697 [Conglomerata obtusa]